MGGGMSIEMYLAEREDPGLDAAFQERIWEEFGWQSGLDASHLSVDVTDRIATLGGTVGSYPQMLEAERAARRVVGVEAVHNLIKVGLSPEAQRSDEEIAAEVRQVLAANGRVPHCGVEVTVGGGRVYLAGAVTSGRDRRAVEEAIEVLVGVRGIDNLIAVEPGTRPARLTERVDEALHRDPALRGDRISVDVLEDVVVLGGRVHSLAERDEADRTAWLPGVRAVSDRLEIHA